MTTCIRLIGKEGEDCQTCGRKIVRRDIGTQGSYALEHEGLSIASRLYALNEQRKREQKRDHKHRAPLIPDWEDD